MTSSASIRKRVGLIGCGVVGRRLGARILQAGFDVVVHDRHQEKADPLVSRGAVWSPSASSLGSECGTLVSALPRGDDVVEALMSSRGAWSAMERGALHIDTSTIGVACARTLAAEAQRRKIRYLDAPLSAAGMADTEPTLALFVAGNADHYDLARPLLSAMAEHVHFLGGPAGLGQVAKLVNNLTSHCMTVVLADALAMGMKAGLSIELLRAALHDGTAQCRVLDELLPAGAFGGDWRPGLRLDLALKDLTLAEELSRETSVEQNFLRTTRAVYEEAADRGWGELSSHAVLRLQEERASVSFRSRFFERRPEANENEPPLD